MAQKLTKVAETTTLANTDTLIVVDESAQNPDGSTGALKRIPKSSTGFAFPSDITSAINTEVSNRNTAITNAINTEVTNRNNAIESAVKEANLTKADAIVKSASGEVASFSDGGNGLLVKSLNVNITPKQSGSGDPSPSNVRPISGYSEVNVTRCGFNVWDEEWQLGYVNPSTGAITPRSDRICTKNFVTVAPNTAYYFKDPSPAYMTAVWYDENQARIRNNSPHNEVITSPSNARYLRFSMPSEYGTTYLNDVCVNVSETSKNGTYEPYVGNTYPISLGQTVYGGTLDVVSGEGSVGVGITKLKDLNWVYQTAQARFYTSSLANVILKPSTTADIPQGLACECYKLQEFIEFGYMDKRVAVATSGNVFIKDLSYTDVASFLADMGEYKIAYPLATPTEITLTPTEVKTLLGQNNIWADSGEVEVEYRADTTLAYNELLSLIASLS